MKRLTILRHATASMMQLVADDFERTLEPRGEEEAAEMGRQLSKRQIKPEQLVSSPAKRAITTAAIVAGELHYPVDDIAIEAEIYNAELQTLLDIVQHFSNRFDHVMLVGHNPGLSELGHYLTGQGQALPPPLAYW
ncbi:hypothetical protein BOW53_00435 [Solemya pervernicosa gill symbiont]|uniref:Phosphohistidine phosphatase n=2 Tax=Gammaproteobacteria incertae sedis TaxID=118884 RepID=A0A1T2LBG4_9GAMM|nr:histidine phosphatase family protein [Candidatus Reidiella endopervernicosa]OOZ42342.1 hypothetical protein BOW53_00435 [Solemya pervernicosa gill symbiont]QKQ25730.1 histidine phosphatase family protein [Candidatus Reidiella endopervernicosa]